MIRSLSLTASVLALALAACGGEGGTGKPPETTAAASSADIVATAKAAGQFNTLLAAVKAAGLEDTLKGPGPFTVFAPNDDAFAKLPAGTVDTLLKPENKEKLRAVLTYHVVSGKVGSTDASKLSTAKTVNGKELKLASGGQGLTVNGAHVVKADIAASNGVIHVIDAVVIPE